MKKIRESKVSKFLVYYFSINIITQIIAPTQAYALTSGPTQPEFNSFTPIGTSDMVDLGSGNYNYNIPIMDVGGYPINLSYNGGVTMDQEASWVGLGWNLNVGQIERQVRGLPDDFNGDEIRYQNDLRDNITVGTHFGLNGALFGVSPFKAGVGLGVQYNNYEGITFKPSYGITAALGDNVAVGLNFSSSVADGANVNPSVSITKQSEEKKNGLFTSTALKGTGSLGLGFNSRKGVENLNLSVSVSRLDKLNIFNIIKSNSETGGTVGGSISFNNQSFTPSKRIGFDNNSFTFNAALGTEIMGPEFQGQISGHASVQKISSAYRDYKDKAYGYENTQNKKGRGVLDFNRENEKTVTENTNILPTTNYTYDLYSIEGQGVSGMFRPFKSKVTYLSNDNVSDYGQGVSLGVEFGGGNLIHAGIDFKISPSSSTTGGWYNNNKTLSALTEKPNEASVYNYEPITFKMVGSMVVDPEQQLYYKNIYGTKAMHFKISGKRKNRELDNYYHELDNYQLTETKRTQRYSRNQLVTKITDLEAKGDAMINRNINAKSHHTAGIKVLQTDGTHYVYGETSYNKEKIEATFDVSGSNDIELTKGLVGYNGGTSGNNSNNSDKFLNKITTPQYAHSYLITSVLSSDYEDIDNNGPSKNDLGSYTKFEYITTDSNYQWRIPFEANKATFNAGLNSKTSDQKGTYIYGKKELKYLNRIVTKTHVAFFDLSDRKDAIGVAGENGGAGSGRMKKIKTIRLYSLPEVTNSNGQIIDPGIDGKIKPIKTAHFIYSYNLCNGIPNSTSGFSANNNELSNAGGKLTLEKVYFTYRSSNMGKYTPYTFNYGLDNEINNPNYNMKGFDIWGNYKLNHGTGGVDESNPTNTEFPFVEQNKTTADNNAQAWNLKSVALPSGGKITIDIESDDYQYVQNKKAMQMFQLTGAGNGDINATSVVNNQLYSGNNHNRYIYVKLSNDDLGLTSVKFKEKYLKENYSKYIQFRALLNMTGNSNQKEYVSGYFQLDKTLEPNVSYISNLGTYAALPLKMLTLDGKLNSNEEKINPIAKTGWGFGRMYLNREVYSLGGDSNNTNIKSIILDLVGSIAAISELFTGPNKKLQSKGCARVFNPNKSWVRLENPNGKKLGGGLRVKSVRLSDEWQSILSESTSGTSFSEMEYGQEYFYEKELGKSSGVATYEPNGSSENALVEPFHPTGQGYAERIAAPSENNYVEKPFGENFYPSPSITYSKVTVKNLDRDGITKHATGKVVTEHYTSYDFPTKVEMTNLDMRADLVDQGFIGSLISLANIRVRNHLTATQGFSIETNDMNGKIKTQSVYKQGNDLEPISKVEYKYNVNENDKTLNSEFTVIDNKGQISKKLLGLDYDLIHDFNQSESTNIVAGFDANLATILYAIFPAFVPIPLPKYSENENKLNTAVTTKHVHKTGILVEKIAYDLGSFVSTKNLAWDAQSAEVLLTETINEYDDKYYSFNYPAYWMYENMGLASNNIGIKGALTRMSNTYGNNNPYYTLPATILNQPEISNDIRKVFKLGDEIYTGLDLESDGSEITQSNNNTLVGTKLWVVGYNSNNTGVLLMDRNGNYINPCGNTGPATLLFKIVLSGIRNLTTASMASVTLMKNPLVITNTPFTGSGYIDLAMLNYNASSAFNPRVINSSAVVYSDFWNTQLENNLPEYPSRGSTAILANGDVNYPFKTNVNPYVLNIKGDWKAEKSYAYLSGRKSGDGVINNPRNEGFYTKFNPFYRLVDNQWQINESNWTYASSITQYNPYGAELENKDALERYSSAQYGYNYSLPTALASNSKYTQMGFEGFEETPKNDGSQKHFSFNNVTNLNLSANHSHTGKKSIKTTPSQSVKLTRIKNGIYRPGQVNCPVTGGGNGLPCPISTYSSSFTSPGIKRVRVFFGSNTITNVQIIQGGGANLSFTNNYVELFLEYDAFNGVENNYITTQLAANLLVTLNGEQTECVNIFSNYKMQPYNYSDEIGTHSTYTLFHLGFKPECCNDQ
jgi:hypothetical protein